ncbi:cell division protein FtsZ [Candidatus Parcubacteria bacterium]|nr:cell division protein FtsZ [Candidatus Parcubacteria bacterium]
MVRKKNIKKVLVKKPAKKASLSDSLKGECHRTKIKVIGIGGGGSSIISEIATKLKKADFVAANTDFYALKELPNKVKRFQFGQSLTQGLGAGMQPEVGAEAAQIEKERIKKIMEGHDLCIFVASLGGGTGSGAAPVFAKLSKELKNITYGIFTMPFSFEGEKKAQIAKESLDKLRPYLNAFTIIPNERIFQVIDKNTPLKQALAIVNKKLSQSLEGLIEMIYSPGLVNIDFADFKTISERKGRLAYLNTIEVQGDGRAEEAVKKIASNPLYPYNIKGAKGVLFNVCGGKNLGLNELAQISSSISESANSDAKIIFGISQNDKLKNKIKITLLATGCSFGKSVKKQPSKAKKEKSKELPQDDSKPKQKTKPKILKVKVKKKPVSLVVPKPKNLIVKPEKKEVQPEKKVIEPEAKKIVKPEKNNLQPEEGKSLIKKVENSLVKSIVGKDLKRRNALQIKKAVEEAEQELLEQETKWDTPAFLRKRKETDK